MLNWRDPENIVGAIVGVAFYIFLAWCSWHWPQGYESSSSPPTKYQSATDSNNSRAIEAAEKSPDKLTDWLLVLFSGLLFGSTVFCGSPLGEAPTLQSALSPDWSGPEF